jgi:hypothetical protein
MKYILLFIFISSAAICNAQTQRIKDLLPKGADINASQYSKETEVRNRVAAVLVARANDDVLLILNGKLYKGPQTKAPLNKLHSTDITCMEVITDKQLVKVYTTDTTIRKVLIIEAKQ